MKRISRSRLIGSGRVATLPARNTTSSPVPGTAFFACAPENSSSRSSPVTSTACPIHRGLHLPNFKHSSFLPPAVTQTLRAARKNPYLENQIEGLQALDGCVRRIDPGLQVLDGLIRVWQALPHRDEGAGLQSPLLPEQRLKGDVVIEVEHSLLVVPDRYLQAHHNVRTSRLRT